jgi:hypothetical protein
MKPIWQEKVLLLLSKPEKSVFFQLILDFC